MPAVIGIKRTSGGVNLLAMTALSRKLIAGFAALGLVASAAATWAHYQLLANPGYTSFCDITATVSCKQADLSRYGSSTAGASRADCRRSTSRPCSRSN